ncbi:MAG: DUF1338 domain-containing protein [Halofilum sp. (in: g-proteobacteria)]|nr:DUF1338 domain-containing protein [Halofilum sp. (in: g-proteobacteria)]
MSEAIQFLFDRLWSDFIRINPQAQRLQQLLADRGDRVVTDHIALRTFRHDRLGIDATAQSFERLGYSAGAEYEFPERKLHGRHYEHPAPGMPGVFISELKLEECSRGLRDIVAALTRQVDTAALPEDALVLGGCPWYPVLHDSYQRLRSESEYAAWVAAFGYRANHFTVSVNALESFDSLAELNAFLRDNGFGLNDREGEIMGSPETLLEQSATLAAPCEVQFADGRHDIPGGYLEFALRHPLPNGELFSGFVTGAADRIFDSTDFRDIA